MAEMGTDLETAGIKVLDLETAYFILYYCQNTNTSSIFHRTRKDNIKICMEP